MSLKILLWRARGDGLPHTRTDDALADLVGPGVGVLVTIGQIKTSKTRERAFAVAKAGASLPVIVSPNAYRSRHATVGAGTMVMHGAVVNAACVVGENRIVNSMALLEHDVSIGDHTHIATGARVNGGVKIGPCVSSGREPSYITISKLARVYNLAGTVVRSSVQQLASLSGREVSPMADTGTIAR